MCNIIEKVAEYKKASKLFIKAAIKAKIFADAVNKVRVKISKDYDKAENKRTVTLTIENCGYKAVYEAQVATRVFNKVEPEFFAKLIEQTAKIKNFGGLTVC